MAGMHLASLAEAERVLGADLHSGFGGGGPCRSVCATTGMSGRFVQQTKRGAAWMIVGGIHDAALGVGTSFFQDLKRRTQRLMLPDWRSNWVCSPPCELTVAGRGKDGQQEGHGGGGGAPARVWHGGRLQQRLRQEDAGLK